MADFRDNAGRQGKARGSGIFLCLFCRGQHLLQRSHPGSHGPCAFIHEEDSGHSPANLGVFIGEHIIRSHDAGSPDIIHIQHLSRHIKVHNVPCIIPIEEQDSRTGFRFLGHIVNLLRGRRLEHTANATAVQQVLPHISKKQRQMPGASAGNDSHLSLFLLCRTVAAEVILHIFHHVRVGSVDSAQHVVCIVFRGIDNFFHFSVLLKNDFFWISPLLQLLHRQGMWFGPVSGGQGDVIHLRNFLHVLGL